MSAKTWDTLANFSVNPKLTFFGMDKNKAHCFTLPKAVYNDYIRYFGLREGKLQKKIFFEINGKIYPAMIRWARQDRSKTYKLRAKDLPERDVVQFQWMKHEMTVFAIKDNFREAYSDIEDVRKTKHRINFYHLEKDVFLVR